MDGGKQILKLQGIDKGFSGVSVLKGIDLEVYKGEVRAVLGANGAGKSTLMKIIGGVYRPDSGRIFLNNESVELLSPNDARSKGITVIYQELSLVPTLDAISNVFLGREKMSKGGFIDRKKMLGDYEGICRALNFDIPPFAKVSRLSIAQQQMIEIMKAVSSDAEIIIMDEPTTSLTEKEKTNLFDIIFKLKERGKTILYISHMLDEIFKISDRITVLKDGALQGTFLTCEMDKNSVISVMTGKKDLSVVQVRRKEGIAYSEDPVLEVRNLNRGKVLKDISFKLYKGEILGIAGLVGSGRTELCMALFGAELPETGDIFLDGTKVNIKSTIDAIRNGIGLIPEDRKNLGLVQIHEVYKNSTVLQLEKMRRRGLLSRRKELKFTNAAVEKLGIKLSSVYARAKNLSGGNQQKVVVSKWLDMNLKVLIFDEPTKGIDVAAKEDIFKIAVDFANKGLGIIFVSSDLDEVARLSHRVIVMRNGKIVSELADERVNMGEINYSALNG